MDIDKEVEAAWGQVIKDDPMLLGLGAEAVKTAIRASFKVGYLKGHAAGIDYSIRVIRGEKSSGH